MESNSRMEKQKDGIVLSIIIPFFNRKKYLKECLQSLWQNIMDGGLMSNEVNTHALPNGRVQKMTNSANKMIEIILVDDASTDGSIEVCNKYIQKFQHIKLISHTSKKGVANSRNEGMQAANGQYLFFIDSDDRMEKQVLSNLLAAVRKNPDLVLFDYVQLMEDKVLEVKRPVGNCEEGFYQKEEILDNPYWNMQLPSQAWRYLLRRELQREQNLQFPDLEYGEDSLFTMDVLLYAKTVYYLKKEVYAYRINVQNSLSSQAMQKRKKILPYYKARFAKVAEWMSRYQEKQVFLQQWFCQWCTQCIRSFLFEKDWLRMIQELAYSCKEIPSTYMTDVTEDLSIDTYFLRYKYQLLTAMHAADKVYLLPTCQDNVILAEKLKKDGGLIHAFLDNNISAGNHNLKYAKELGYFVYAVKEILAKKEEPALYIICHWKRVIDNIQQQLLEHGIQMEQMILMEW